jgi:hypothetical protein
VSEPCNTGVPPVPTTVYEGDEQGARAAYADFSSKAGAQGFRYVMLRKPHEIVQSWGTPPAVG